MSQSVITPSTIGPYTLRGTIGSGAFSIVKLIYNEESREFFACKIVPKIRLMKGDLVKRFEMEIRINQQIHHPGVVGIVDLLKDDFNYYIVMEFCPNGDLFQYIIDRNRISEEDAKPILRSILETLDFIHRIKIAHRDMKPENILIDNTGRPKLSDFGLSKFIISENGLTSTPCGSPCYASPECISGKPYDPRKSDIWSVGVILFAMLTAQLPWTKHNQTMLFKQIINGDYRVPDFVSHSAESFIRGLMCVDSKKRMTIEQCFDHPFLKNCREQSGFILYPVKLINIRRIDKLFDKDSESCSNLFDSEAIKSPSLNEINFKKALKIISAKLPRLYIRNANTFIEKPVEPVEIDPDILVPKKRQLPPTPLDVIAKARKRLAQKTISGSFLKTSTTGSQMIKTNRSSIGQFDGITPTDVVPSKKKYRLQHKSLSIPLPMPPVMFD